MNSVTASAKQKMEVNLNKKFELVGIKIVGDVINKHLDH